MKRDQAQHQELKYNFMEKMSKLIMRRNENAGSISKPDKGGTNPVVLVHGYGTMSLDRLKKEIVARTQQLADTAKEGNFENVFYNLCPAGTSPTILQSFVRAYMDVTAELERQSKDRVAAKNAPLNENVALIEIWPDGRYTKSLLKG